MILILMCAIILSSCLTNLDAAVTIANAITSMCRLRRSGRTSWATPFRTDAPSTCWARAGW